MWEALKTELFMPPYFPFFGRILEAGCRVPAVCCKQCTGRLGYGGLLCQNYVSLETDGNQKIFQGTTPPYKGQVDLLEEASKTWGGRLLQTMCGVRTLHE